MPITIQLAAEEDAALVSAVLSEAAMWLQQSGREMWLPHEVAVDRVQPDVSAGHYYFARSGQVVTGVVKFQLLDQVFWPDVPHEDSAFIHRLAVCRAFSGGGVSRALVDFGISKARSLNRRYLRLDCAADRPSLREVYEGFGFKHHSNFQVGPWSVARYELLL